MEVKINREISSYAESVFMGLDMRQLVFCLSAVLASVGWYFILRDVLPISTLSWVCVLASAPFAVLGFFTYNQMTAFEFLKVFVRYAFLESRVLMNEEINIYTDYLLSDLIGRNMERRYMSHDELNFCDF